LVVGIRAAWRADSATAALIVGAVRHHSAFLTLSWARRVAWKAMGAPGIEIGERLID